MSRNNPEPLRYYFHGDIIPLSNPEEIYCGHCELAIPGPFLGTGKCPHSNPFDNLKLYRQMQAQGVPDGYYRPDRAPNIIAGFTLD